MQVLGPLKPDEEFLQEDFNLLEKYIYQSSAEKIEKEVEKLSVMTNR